jgi:hypothetical protein
VNRPKRVMVSEGAKCCQLAGSKDEKEAEDEEEEDQDRLRNLAAGPSSSAEIRTVLFDCFSLHDHNHDDEEDDDGDGNKPNPIRRQKDEVRTRKG